MNAPRRGVVFFQHVARMYVGQTVSRTIKKISKHAYRYSSVVDRYAFGASPSLLSRGNVKTKTDVNYVAGLRRSRWNVNKVVPRRNENHRERSLTRISRWLESESSRETAEEENRGSICYERSPLERPRVRGVMSLTRFSRAYMCKLRYEVSTTHPDDAAGMNATDATERSVSTMRSGADATRQKRIT